MSGWDAPSVDRERAATTARPGRGRALVALIAGGLGLLSVILPWVRWQTLDGYGTRAGWNIPGAGWMTAFAAAGLIVSGGAGLLGRSSPPRALLVALLVWMAAPALVVTGVAEAVGGSVVGWLMPVVSAGRLVTVNPGGGAWLAVIAGAGGTALVLVDPRRGQDAATATGHRRSAAVTVAISSIGLLVARALPWYTIEVVEVTTGQQVVDAVASQVSLEITGADIPLTGQLTLAAVVTLVAVAALALRRMTDWLVTLAGTAGGTLLLSAWLSLAFLDGSNSVIPDGWLSLGRDDEVVAVRVAPALFATVALSVVLLAAAAVAHRADRQEALP